MISSIITSMFTLVICVGACVFLLSKSLFLAPYRAGWLLLLANVVYEICERRLGWRRNTVDAAMLPALTVGSWVIAGPAAAIMVAMALGLAWGRTLLVDLKWRSGQLARQYGPEQGRVPLPVPQLIVSVRGPVIDRHKDVYFLGDWPEGTCQGFEVILLNPSLVRPQLPLSISVVSKAPGITVSVLPETELSAPEPGEVAVLKFHLTTAPWGAGGDVLLQVTHGDFIFERRLRIGTIVPRSEVQIQGAAIRRWKYGARAAFVWRGDQDLYDPATLQSEEGLRVTLGLARRFRMPSSLMLSARLSLVQEEHEAFCRHFGWNRMGQEIPDFIRFLRQEVDKTPEQEWPVATDRPFAAEIGNHFYLHYGTHAAADAGNRWKSHARIGDGRYPWMSQYPADSFTEQRDNALKGSQVLEETLGEKPASFTIPGDVYDTETARAAEAAGLDVGSETDASKFAKLVLFPAPHHPKGCSSFVELTRMHPRDPENACQLAMLKYWVGAARRTGKVLVFLAHHHLARYEGSTCYHLTEELLRHVLADQQGDVYAATLTAVGRYWRDIMSPKTRCVKITVTDKTIRVTNNGARHLTGLPLEIDIGSGRRFMRLIEVAAHEVLELSVFNDTTHTAKIP